MNSRQMNAYCPRIVLGATLGGLVRWTLTVVMVIQTLTRIATPVAKKTTALLIASRGDS